MNPNLYSYARAHIELGGRLVTEREVVKSRISKIAIDLEQHIDVKKSYQTDEKLNPNTCTIKDLTGKWLDEQSHFQDFKTRLLNCYDLRQYSNVIDEAEGIINLRKQLNSKLYVATNNEVLATTINAQMGVHPKSDNILAKQLWLQSSESIFLLNRIRHINHCCNHPWVLESIKSNLFYKNHIVRNQIISTFSDYIKDLDYKCKYEFSYLLKLHYDFIVSISRVEVKNVLQDMISTCPSQVTIYEYIRIIDGALDSALCSENTDMNDEIELISVDEIPWLEDNAKLWVGGLSINHNLEVKYLSTPEKVIGYSYSIFENGDRTHPHPKLLISSIEDLATEYNSYLYRYVAPSPKVERRKNAFAINHVTKLLNNPHNFYIESILKLKSYNFHPNHIVGILVHSVFEILIKKATSFKSFDEVKKEIDLLLSLNYFSKMDYVVISKKVEIMLKNLWELIKNSSELYAEHEGIQKIIHNGKEYFLHGRADLLYKKDGKWGVIDFKTGTPPSWVNIINGSAPQISIAMLMLRFGGFLGTENLELADSGFISPKGLFSMSHDSFIVQSAVDGIKNLISVFWEQETPYYLHIHDVNFQDRLIARSSCEAN